MRFAVLTAIIAIGMSSFANADLVMSTSGWTDLTYTVAGDQSASMNVSGFQGTFFGQTVQSFSGATPRLWISENGFVSFKSVNSFDLPFIGSNVNQSLQARISPLWDDYVILDPASNANRVSAHYESGQYFGATWSNVQLNFEIDPVSGLPIDAPTNRSAQMLWFESDVALRGVQFHANDIVFSYIPDKLGTSNFGDQTSAVVALEDGTVPLKYATGAGVGLSDVTNWQNHIAIPPNTFTTYNADGYLTNFDAQNLAYQDNSFMLYRWQPGSQSYDVSIGAFTGPLTAVPEPFSLLTGSASIGMMLVVANRKRRNRSK